MPLLKIDRIVSFSSEDKVHAAKNLLVDDVHLKWKCSSPGEKSTAVVFQLPKASVITGIDIGNEHSAYIEVYVSRSGEIDGEYKTILVMSSFMSALESRESRNINRVRMFKTEHLMKPECDEKWDRIKVVCTQPFNKHVQYGLCFIKFYTNESEPNNSEKMLGKFRLRPESPVDFKGTLFSKRKEQTLDKPLSAASSIREATSSLLNDSKNSPARSSKLLPSFIKTPTLKKDPKDSVLLDESSFKPRNRNELFYTEDEEKPHPKIDKLIEKKIIEKKEAESAKKAVRQIKKGEQKHEDKKKVEQQGPSKMNDETIKEKNATETKKKKEVSGEMKVKPIKNGRESIKRKLEVESSTSKKLKTEKIVKPFDKLLENVVLVISGIQNPDRANLREKILQMGGKYRAAWDSSCTHLVCAFMNTPKFNEVKGKGRIVTRQWVEECYSQRKRIPWRRYALDKREQNKEESEEEICEEIDVPKSPSPQPEEPSVVNSYDDTMEEPSDTEEKLEHMKNLCNLSKENSDSTEVEESNVLNDDPYTVLTDTEENPPKEKMKKPFDFFKGKTFFLDHNFEDTIEDMLKNYIFIHEGCLADDPTENVDYIICGKEEAHNLNEINLKAICLLPDWIVDCHKCRQFIPPDEYFIL